MTGTKGPTDTAEPTDQPTKGSGSAALESGRLLNDDVVRLLCLLRSSDSVELKATVPADAQVATIRGLPIDPIEGQLRQVFFFDTPDLALDRAGVVVRARRSQGGRGDTVIKLRPVVPDTLSPDLRRLLGFNVEVDMLPGGFVCSASLKARTTVQAVREAAGGALKLSKLFSREQRAFYAEHAPEGIGLDSLAVLGPTFVLKYQFAAAAPRLGQAGVQRVVAELWLWPDGSRILELSMRCPTGEALQAAADARAYLSGRGIDLAGAQATKTRAALQFYSAQLRASRA